jgi:hypothetical protein
VLLTLLEHLPASVLEMIAGTLLIVAIGCVLSVFAALVSEGACRRIIRLLNALAKLTNNNFRGARRKRNERSQ